MIKTPLFSSATVTRTGGNLKAADLKTADVSSTGSISSFNDRFAPSMDAPLPSSMFSPRPFIRSLSSEVETKIQQAKNRLAQKLQSQDWRADLVDGPLLASASATDSRIDGKVDGLKPSIGASIPLPRSPPG